LHELESITGVNNARLEHEVERQLSILQMIFEVEISGAPIHALWNLGERQIVGRDQTNGSMLHHDVNYQSSSFKAIMRIRSREQLVQQKQDGDWALRRVRNQLETLDLGVESLNSALQGIENTNRCANRETRHAQPFRSNRRTALRQNRVHANPFDKRALLSLRSRVSASAVRVDAQHRARVGCPGQTKCR
jgi:hypothetical protein